MREHERTLTRFAATHKLKLRTDEDDTKIIPGKSGQIYEHDSGVLGVLVCGEGKMWNLRRKTCIAIGMQLHQDGDCEGSLWFDPLNADQVKLAIRVAGTKRRQIMSEAKRESVMRNLEKCRVL